MDHAGHTGSRTRRRGRRNTRPPRTTHAGTRKTPSLSTMQQGGLKLKVKRCLATDLEPIWPPRDRTKPLSHRQCFGSTFCRSFEKLFRTTFSQSAMYIICLKDRSTFPYHVFTNSKAFSSCKSPADAVHTAGVSD